jgi:threonine/homoserine/homoserine lactone efflux protein
VLCIRRTLSDGRAVGFVSGLGAATADAAYGCIAGFGLTAVANLLVGQQFWFGLIGGLFLCYLGAKTFRAKPAERAAASSGAGLAGAYVSTLFLTLTNPATILSFIAVFAGIGMGGVKEYGAAARLVGGVFLGSAFWWLLLSGGVGLLRDRVTPVHLQWINRLSGVILGGFGVLALINLVIR